MKSRRLVGSVLLSLIGAGALHAAPLAEGLTEQLATLGPDETARVVVVMKERPLPRRSGLGIGVLEKAEKAQLIRDVRAAARLSQRSLLNDVLPAGVRTLDVGSTANVKQFWVVNAIALDATPEMVEKIAARSDVEAVYPNFSIPSPEVTESEPPEASGQFTWGLQRVRIPEVRALYGLTGEGVRVGILDTGIDPTHPDLEGRILAFKDFSQGQKEQPYDDQGHGSHTSGTIVGGNSSGQYIGVAPGARLIVAKIFGPQGATLQGILGAMQWVIDPDGDPETDDGAQVVSNSWGNDNPTNRVFWDAVKRWVDLDIFPSFAAGNNGPNTVGTPGGFPHSFAVGASDPDDALSEFSSRGPTKWDDVEYIKPNVTAPGSGILSAWHKGNGFTAIQGTSMACPHVSGIVALLYQANPELTVDEIREILESTAEDQGDPGKDNLYGSGIVNALAAVARVVPSGLLSGTFKDHEGNPLQGRVIIGDNVLSVSTDEAGQFQATLPEKTFTITARVFGYKDVTFEAAVEANGTSTRDIVFEPAEVGTLAGQVTDSEGKPLRARLQVQGTSLNAIETDPETGSFQIELPLGSYEIRVTAFGYEPMTVPVALASGADALAVAMSKVPPILFIDDDQYDLMETYFTKALDALGKTYTHWDSSASGNIPAEVLVQYPLVVWHTGFDFRKALQEDERAALSQYLETGGHAYISGQNLGVQLRQDTYLAEVLHTRWKTVIRRSSGEVPSLLGVEDDPITNGLILELNGEGTQDNQDFPDVLEPADDSAKLILTYDGRPEGGAALRINSGAAKVIYTGFGLEGVRGVEARQDFVSRVMADLAPTAEDTLERLVAFDAKRRQALDGSDAAEANLWSDYTDGLLAKAVEELAATEDAETILARVAGSLSAAERDVLARVERELSARRRAAQQTAARD